VKEMNKKIDGVIEAVLKPSISASVYGLIGRGVSDIKSNDRGEIIFIMSDGTEINIGNLTGLSLPHASEDILGGIKVGKNLKIDENGILSVDITDKVSEDNTKPVTSGAVYTEVGNIESLLKAL
jgi:hypothetical protein